MTSSQLYVMREVLAEEVVCNEITLNGKEMIEVLRGKIQIQIWVQD